ncbi:MAG TPA: hypothetical protein VNF92_11765 [Gemmatimonadaceae bacterium]|nr:hypothetical protein [Gemmatimonadaceae bacterium]
MARPDPEIPACCRGRQVLSASVRTSVIVGTALTAINQWPALIGGGIAAGVLVRVAFNYLVPFLVAYYSRAALARELMTTFVRGPVDA